MAVTVREICTRALRLINVVETNEVPSDSDIQVTLDAFDGMVDSWSNDRLMIYNIDPYLFSYTAGVSTYTLGPSGAWNITPRPIRIEQGYVRWLTGIQAIDLPIFLANDSQFADIPVKEIPSTFPFALYDDAADPLRLITIWPVPTVNGTIVLWLRQPLVDFTTIDQDIIYPPGYLRAFAFNLAVEIAPEFSKIVTPEISRIATESKAELARLNTVAQYSTGDGAMSTRRKPFNWITGNFTPVRW